MSTSEVGHAKNVANFEDLISFCTGYGASYNPSLAILSLAQLTVLKNNAAASVGNSVSKYNLYKSACNNRELTFAPVKKTCTRVLAALKASGATKQTVDDALTINRKMQGRRGKLTKADAGKAAASSSQDASIPNSNNLPVEEPVPPKQISSAQLSYDSQVEHLGKLIDLLSGLPGYNPNENDLKLVALNALLANMKATNTAVINAYTAWSNTRIVRDKALYTKNTGLVDVALNVKNYVKSVFGASSLEYKQVGKLRFKKQDLS